MCRSVPPRAHALHAGAGCHAHQQRAARGCCAMREHLGRRHRCGHGRLRRRQQQAQQRGQQHSRCAAARPVLCKKARQPRTLHTQRNACTRCVLCRPAAGPTSEHHTTQGAPEQAAERATATRVRGGKLAGAQGQLLAGCGALVPACRQSHGAHPNHATCHLPAAALQLPGRRGPAAAGGTDAAQAQHAGATAAAGGAALLSVRLQQRQASHLRAPAEVGATAAWRSNGHGWRGAGAQASMRARPLAAGRNAGMLLPRRRR